MNNHWPFVIKDQEIQLRPLRFRDRKRWKNLRALNHDWLLPWEATVPPTDEMGTTKLPSFLEMVKIINEEARHGRTFSWAIWHGSNIIGQISLGGVIYGAMRGAHIGYWIDQKYINRGITTRAVEILTSYAFEELKLHRIEINLRPENLASRRVAEKAGYIFEGNRPRYLHINGQWRDHVTFVRENSDPN